ncbi:hypothetical protein ACOME3_003798 [Neoechinorhynchus agilis]
MEKAEEAQSKKDHETSSEESFTLRIRYSLNRSLNSPNGPTSSPTERIIDQKVMSGQLVQELIQVLMDRSETCHKSCFLLRLPDGSPLENFAEISSFKQIQQTDVVIDMTDEPYSPRDIRAHVLHINELIWSTVKCDEDSFNGYAGYSPSFLPSALSESDPGKSSKNSCLFHRSRNRHSRDPGSLDSSLPVHISYSGWNPPLPYKRLHGDLAYLCIQTNPWSSKASSRVLHVTACSRGFFINQCTNETFDPNPANGRTIFHSIVDLLMVNCPDFRKQWRRILDMRNNLNPLVRLPVSPVPEFSWLCPRIKPSFDLMRANCAEIQPILLYSDLSVALCSPVGQNRDWNEELQASHELPCDTAQQQLIYDRTTFRVMCDFVGTAVRCAKTAVEGQLPSINPSDAVCQQMFIHNNLFISFGFDVRDHYASHGGNEAAHAAARYDIRGIQVLEDMAWAARTNNEILDDFRTVGTVVVDYGGYKTRESSHFFGGCIEIETCICHEINKEQDKSVVYGSVNFGKSFVDNTELAEKLNAIADKMGMSEQEILCGKFEENPTSESSEKDLKAVKVRVPVEWKVIHGNDGRHYILDLIRVTPPDANWLGTSTNFPATEYPHKLASLRSEYFEGLIRRNPNEKYNFNMFQPLVRFSGDVDGVDQIKEIARNLCEEVVPSFVKAILSSYTTMDPSSSMLLVPLDGQQLTDTMHLFGLNVRYLGEVFRCIKGMAGDECTDASSSDIENIDSSSNGSLIHLKSLVISEIWVRSMKHMFRNLMTTAAPMTEHIVSFLNCALFPNQEIRKSKKSKSQSLEFIQSTNCFYRRLALIARVRFNFHCFETISSFSQMCSHLSPCLEFTSALRRICQQTGIQLFTSYQTDVPFTIDDISGFFPRIKTKVIKSHTLDRAHRLITEARQAVSECQFRAAFEAITCAHGILTSVYGPLNDEVAICLRMSARLNFILGETAEALVLQHRATLVAERINGVDSAMSIRDYCHLAHYCFATVALRLLEKNKDVSNEMIESDSGLPNLNDKAALLRAAIKYSTRARYIACISGGQSLFHPKLFAIEANLALMIQSYDILCSSDLAPFANSYADSALKRSQALMCRPSKHLTTSTFYAVFGPNAPQTGLMHQVRAQVHLCQLNFHEAVQHQKHSVRISEGIHGPSHFRTEHASAKMKTMIEQGVLYKKQMKQLYGDKAMAKVLLSGKPSPSNFINRTIILHTVLDIMNSINGFMTLKDNEIIFIKFPTSLDSTENPQEVSSQSERGNSESNVATNRENSEQDAKTE